MVVIAVSDETYKIVNLTKGMYITNYPDEKMPSNNVIIKKAMDFYFNKLSIRFNKGDKDGSISEQCQPVAEQGARVEEPEPNNNWYKEQYKQF